MLTSCCVTRDGPGQYTRPWHPCSGPKHGFQKTRLTVTREMLTRYGLVLDGDERSDAAADFRQEIQSGVRQLPTGVFTAGRSGYGKGPAVRESYLSGFA
jgi:hypothetical protein